MDEQALLNFVSDEPLVSFAVPSPGDCVPFDKELVEAAFKQCLSTINSNGAHPFYLRQAKREDIDAMTSLVQGLADYCQESEAVKMTGKDYIQDGFSLDNPLWYCLLIEKKNDEGKYVTCGYAFFYVGYTFGKGRFIYLEDLYLEVNHRGSGGGTIVMKTLAALCRSIQCTRLVWQALDWNIAALEFYNKIGAKIHPGEKTTRYAANALEHFAESRTS